MVYCINQIAWRNHTIPYEILMQNPETSKNAVAMTKLRQYYFTSIQFMDETLQLHQINIAFRKRDEE
jgi:hypothetical protein